MTPATQDRPGGPKPNGVDRGIPPARAGGLLGSSRELKGDNPLATYFTSRSLKTLRTLSTFGATTAWQ
jgi:hypothetical protein